MVDEIPEIELVAAEARQVVEARQVAEEVVVVATRKIHRGEAAGVGEIKIIRGARRAVVNGG